MGEDRQLALGYASLGGKKLQADFDGGTLTSDAGALLRREVDRCTGLIDRVVGALHEWRDPRYVVHGLGDLVRQRIFQIARGDEDANDADALGGDPALTAACERRPLSGPDLASQPTLSRWENPVLRTPLRRRAYALGEAFIASFATPPRRLLLDLDDTADTVPGAPQLARFNAPYGDYGYQPLHLYDGLRGRRITTVRRSGRTPKGGWR